jgi:hypothetical protein
MGKNQQKHKTSMVSMVEEGESEEVNKTGVMIMDLLVIIKNSCRTPVSCRDWMKDWEGRYYYDVITGPFFFALNFRARGRASRSHFPWARFAHLSV